MTFLKELHCGSFINRIIWIPMIHWKEKPALKIHQMTQKPFVLLATFLSWSVFDTSGVISGSQSAMQQQGQHRQH